MRIKLLAGSCTHTLQSCICGYICGNVARMHARKVSHFALSSVKYLQPLACRVGGFKPACALAIMIVRPRARLHQEPYASVQGSVASASVSRQSTQWCAQRAQESCHRYSKLRLCVTRVMRAHTLDLLEFRAYRQACYRKPQEPHCCVTAVVACLQHRPGRPQGGRGLPSKCPCAIRPASTRHPLQVLRGS